MALLFFLPTTVEALEIKAQAFHGVPAIIDGDTVQFGAAKLQFEGADAPQIDQLCFDKSGARWKCGMAARETLVSLAGSKSWTCQAVRMNQFGRWIANCQTGYENVARKMVETGWALASTSGSSRYLSSEASARADQKGMRVGAFVAPLDWRQHNWHAAVLGAASIPVKSRGTLLSSACGDHPPSTACSIKGNVNSSGQCIFHKPGGHWYKRISVEPAHGDRWFCSATEAVASGCRETRR